MSRMTPEELDRLIGDAEITFSINCSSGLCDSSKGEKCNCWRCRQERGEPYDATTEALASQESRRRRQEMRAYLARLTGKTSKRS